MTDSAIWTPEDQALRDALAVRPPSEIVEWINSLIYGDPGVGKTHLMGTAMDYEATSPLLVLDVEGGMATLSDRPNVDVVPVRSVQQVVDVYNKLYPTIKDGKLLYKTIGIDSLTELADLDIREVMLKEHKAKPDKIEKDVATQAAWGKTRTHMRDIIRAFRDLPCNVIFIAAVGKENEPDQPSKFYPGFAGKLRTEVPGFMDIVGYYTADVSPVNGEVTRKLQVQGSRRVVAKDRTGAFGSMVTNPTIPMMWDILQKHNSQITSQLASS